MNSWILQLLFAVLLMYGSCPLWALSVSTTQAPRPDSPEVHLTPSIQTTKIYQADIDAQEHFAVTDYNSSYIMVWDLYTGAKLKTIQPSVVDGGEGSVTAVAISPDSNTIAVGWRVNNTDQKHVYVFDRKSGQLQQRISGFEEKILHLSYASDGSYLAATLDKEESLLGLLFGSDSSGLRIYRSSDYKEVFSDRDYNSSSHWVEFDSASRLATTSSDGWIRLYQLSSGQWQLIKAYDTKKNPHGLAFSPDHQRLAVGFNKVYGGGVNPKPLLFSSNDLQPLFAPDSQNKWELSNSFEHVSWSRDGQWLWTTGYQRRGAYLSIVGWRQSDESIVRYRVAKIHLSRFPAQRLQNIFSLNNGDNIVLSFSGLTRITMEGEILWQNIQPRVDFHITSRQQRGKPNMKFSQDGSRIMFSLGRRSKRQAWFDLRSQKMIITEGRSSSEQPNWAGKLKNVRINYPGIRITDWYRLGSPLLSAYSPMLNDQKLKMYKYEESESLAIAPGENPQNFVLGTNFFLRKFDFQGKELWEEDLHHNKALSVAISGDKRWLVAGLNDGTLRWYNYANGKEQLALYPHSNGIDWLLWTPKGFFSSSSSEANHLFGYQIYNDGEQTSDFIKVDQLFESFYRPDMVLAQFEGNVSLLEHLITNTGSVHQVLQARPPKLELVDVSQKLIDGTQLTVKLRAINQGGGIGDINVKINKLPLKSRGGIIDVSTSRSREKIINLTFTIPPGKSSITIESPSIARSGQKGVVNSRPLIFDAFSTVKPKSGNSSLIGLAVGIDQYLDPALLLKYAVNDVTSLLRVLKDNSRPLFSSFFVKPVTNEQATKKGIIDAFKLAISSTKEDDVFLFYLAGHGKVINGEYYFLPMDLIYTNTQTLMSNSLSQHELAELLLKVPARKSLIIIDTCYAGSFNPEVQLASSTNRDINDKTVIHRLIHTTGRTIFYASSDKAVALEGYNDHGLFTGVLLDGLRGAASSFNDNYIDTRELKNYLYEFVPKVSMDKFGVSSKSWVKEQGHIFPILPIRAY